MAGEWEPQVVTRWIQQKKTAQTNWAKAEILEFQNMSEECSAFARHQTPILRPVTRPGVEKSDRPGPKNSLDIAIFVKCIDAATLMVELVLKSPKVELSVT